MSDATDNKINFSEMLEETSGRIDWKVGLSGDTKTIYRQKGKTFFEVLAPSECKMEVRSHWKLATPTTISSLMTALIEDRERLIDEGLFLDSRKQVIGFLNGCFDLHTGKLRPYHSSDFICDPLPHTIPEKLNRSVEKWFLGILAQWVGDDTADWFLNALAYLLFEYPNTEQVWFNFFGSGANGKSLCLEILEKALGDDKCIGVDLKHINRFTGATVLSKWLVVGRDSSSEVSDGAVAFIKTYTGDLKLLVERKGGDSTDVPNPGKLVVSTNSLIRSKDRSFAWYRRLLPIPFPNVFARNEGFRQTLLKKLPDIIRVLCHRAYCLKNNKTSLWQSIPKPVNALLQETRMINDRVASFWEGYFFKDFGEKEKSTRVLNKEKLKKIDGMTMSMIYFEFTQWHQKEFGPQMDIEPSSKSFCGPYGEFLSGDAGRYFEYKRTDSGRKVFLKPEYQNL